MFSLFDPRVLGAIGLAFLLGIGGAYWKGRYDGKALEAAACARAALARQQQYDKDLGEVQDRYAQNIAAERAKIDALRRLTDELNDAPISSGDRVCLDAADTERLRQFFKRTAEQLGAPTGAR